MKGAILLFVLITLAVACSSPSLGQDPFVGSWEGHWVREGDSLAVTMEIRLVAEPNQYLASFSSERLRVEGIPFSSVEREGCCGIHLVLQGDATTSRFEGVLEGDVIAGTFVEAALPGTFVLHRAPPRSAPRLDEVEFINGAVRLNGTLVLPGTPSPYPAIVMAHGSGAEGRWANQFLAYRFAEAGVAALIFDKRGVGSSSGDWRTSDLDALASDLAAGVEMLASRGDIRRDHIGLYGHSQGGTLLPLAVERSPHVSFLIASAASGVPMDSLERFSLENFVGVDRLPPPEATDASRYIEAMVAVAYQGDSRERLDSLATDFAGRSWYFDPPGPEDSYWSFSQRIAGYDPISHWRQVRLPVLILFGADDERVPVGASVSAITAALSASEMPFRVCVYPGADHTFRSQGTGDMWPRSAPGYLEDLIAWVRGVTGAAGGGPSSQVHSAACS